MKLLLIRDSPMREHLILYIAIWIVSIIALFTPWLIADNEVFCGWDFIFPFSFTYLIGILLGLVVIIARKSAFVLTIVAGILMIIGCIGAWVGGEILVELSGITGNEVSSYTGGITFAFLWSLVYLIAGSILGKEVST